MLSYILHNPHLVMVDKSIGYYDLELDFWVKNLDQFRQIMEDLTVKFPGCIRDYSYVHDPRLYKMLYIPEE
jgi:hypothetical protein